MTSTLLFLISDFPEQRKKLTLKGVIIAYESRIVMSIILNLITQVFLFALISENQDLLSNDCAT